MTLTRTTTTAGRPCRAASRGSQSCGASGSAARRSGRAASARTRTRSPRKASRTYARGERSVAGRSAGAGPRESRHACRWRRRRRGVAASVARKRERRSGETRRASPGGGDGAASVSAVPSRAAGVVPESDLDALRRVHMVWTIRHALHARRGLLFEPPMPTNSTTDVRPQAQRARDVQCDEERRQVAGGEARVADRKRARRRHHHAESAVRDAHHPHDQKFVLRPACKTRNECARELLSSTNANRARTRARATRAGSCESAQPVTARPPGLTLFVGLH